MIGSITALSHVVNILDKYHKNPAGAPASTLNGHFPDGIVPFPNRADQINEVCTETGAALLKRLVTLELHQPEHFLGIKIPPVDPVPVAAGSLDGLSVPDSGFLCPFEIVDSKSHTD
jgi:hypothetical protein